MTVRRGALAAALVAGAWAGHAAADRGAYVAEPVPASRLDPLIVPALRAAPARVLGVGFGLGLFGARCEDCPDRLGGPALSLYAGAQVSPRLAVLADLWAVTYVLEPGEGVAVHGLATAAARVWVRPELWLQAGAGAAVLSFLTPGPDEHSLGPAASLAIGGELAHRPRSGIDLIVQLGLARHHDDGDRLWIYMATSTVAFHWN